MSGVGGKYIGSSGDTPGRPWILTSISNPEIFTSLCNGATHVGLMRSGLLDCGMYKVRLLESDDMILLAFCDMLDALSSTLLSIFLRSLKIPNRILVEM